MMDNSNQQLQRNKVDIYKTISKCMRIIFVFMIVCMFITMVCDFGIDGLSSIICFGSCSFCLLVPTLLVDVLKIKRTWVIYAIIFCTIMVFGILSAFLSYRVMAIVMFPMLIAAMFFDRKLVLFTTLFTSIMAFVSSALSVYFGVTYSYSNANIDDAIMNVASPTVVILIIMSCIVYFIVDRNANMVEDVIIQSETTNKAQEELIYVFAEISENKSKDTGEHIRRVADYMRILGNASGFSVEYVDKLAKASMMHDIGKIMIPEDILDKPSKLTEKEYAIMKSHTLYGEALLMKAPGDIMNMARIIAAQHHEKWDGTGYMGLYGEQIAYISRLMALADVFDALTSARKYKRGWDLDETYNEIVNQSGKHFDPEVVDLFVEHFDEFKEVLESNPDKTLFEK